MLYVICEQAINLVLNASHLRQKKGITIFLYKNGSGIVPNHVGIYGSTYKEFYIKENFSFDASFEIKESRIKALDKQSRRCDTSQEPTAVSKCVGHFIEHNLNCSMRFLMSNSMLETCNLKVLSKQEFNRIYELYKFKVNRYEESQLFKMTGCMPGCSKSEFELKATRLEAQVNTRMTLQMQLQIPNGEYELIEEYYLYDLDSFIPDVGGYLGLLLGYSLLSMYHTFAQWLAVAKQWLLNSKRVKSKKHQGNEDLKLVSS